MHAEFEVHLLNEPGINNARLLAEEFDKLLLKIETIVSPSRELSIVKTKLEEASFFAKKGMANQKENQRQ